MHCSDCRFWHEQMSQCRRNAPAPLRDADGTARTMWPQVDGRDCCGELQRGYTDRSAVAGAVGAAMHAGTSRSGTHSIDARI